MDVFNCGDAKYRNETDGRAVAKIDSFPNKTKTEIFLGGVLNTKQCSGLGINQKHIINDLFYITHLFCSEIYLFYITYLLVLH